MKLKDFLKLESQISPNKKLLKDNENVGQIATTEHSGHNKNKRVA